MRIPQKKKGFRMMPSSSELTTPTIATHTIPAYKKRAYHNILKDRSLDMATTGEPISLSLDGCYVSLSYLDYIATFVFPLATVKRIAKPAIYLFKRGRELIMKDSYYLQPWRFFFEAEVLVEGQLPLTYAECGLPPKGTVRYTRNEARQDLMGVGLHLCDLPPSGFRETVIEKRKKMRRKGLVGGRGSPPPWLREFIHTYNQLICNLFSLDYQQILTEARKEQYFGEEKGVIKL